MAADLKQRIEKIESKAALIVERYELLVKANAAAGLRIDELEAETRRLKHELLERDRQIEWLRTVSVLSPDHRDVEATRQVLAGLVREIDKCINKLSL